jgi:hypothetical protein
LYASLSFVARVHLLLENSQIIPNHDDFVEECLERDFFRLKRSELSAGFDAQKKKRDVSKLR